MKKNMTTTGDVKIASEEDLLTLDVSTGEKFYLPFTPEDFRRFETETIHVREVAQRAIYPMTGETSHKVTVGVFDCMTGKTVYLKAAFGWLSI